MRANELATKKSYADNTVDKLRAALREMASEQPLRSQSGFARIKEILPEIRDLKSKRFTDSEILQRLRTNGIEMSLGTFRQYVNRAIREHSGIPTNMKRKRTVEPMAKSGLNVVSAVSNNAGNESKVALTHNPNRKL